MSRRRVVVWAVLVTFTASLSCSKAVRIPPSDYAGLEDGPTGYLVVTSAGATYRARRLRVEHDHLVIVSLSEGDTRWKQADLPISIPLDQVVSIERRSFQAMKTVAVVTGTTAAFLVLALVALRLEYH